MVEPIQLQRWRQDFGNAYIERNQATEVSIAKREYAWEQILGACAQDKPSSFLEVGCNVGINLHALANLTQAKLYGIEPNPTALKMIKKAQIVPEDHLYEGSIFDLPFDDNSVDCVFTSGVLIHISPDDLDKAYRELHRVSKKYVLSIEYFAKNPETISYRGHEDMLFKRDFGLKWLELFPDLQPVAQGFLWQPVTGVDDATWWLFRKPAA